ncbi:type II/IV secretion system ATPase subunit [Candidatus Woesearchaeota archaeon]|nr:type II/IV secretion system ATPase subunit [Candidatus Woesearchaeota archaeon]
MADNVKSGIAPLAQAAQQVVVQQSPENEALLKPQGAPEFFIDLRPRLFKLPEYQNKEKINVRYPLLPPYAFAHVFWDEKQKELVYHIEEQILNDTEKELIKLIQLGLEEMINISFRYATKSDLILKYIEKNVQSIIAELGAKVSRESYLKIMYYIYRDFIGLNEMEPMINDPYIEDIECNGAGTPVYIVHRKYQNMRSNIIYEDQTKLIDFVEKLAQKTGRYVSYAKPLLDGSLPDGSRVNATYTSDVTTHGPTFTIRKFTKEPLTPINLISYQTTDPKIMAFVWLAIEHKFNIMAIGETASGKTTFLNALLQFVPSEARIVSIEDTREINLSHENWIPAVARVGFGIPNLLGKQYGEITLFDLLRESFRQNPDYVVVGEVRGKETYVLFQGMASGHASYSTFHAASVETLVRRLETPPINLPASLVDSLDIIISVVHLKDQNKNVRRMVALKEIIEVKQQVGTVDSNTLFEWEPIEDKYVYNGNSHVLAIISKRTGIPVKKLEDEMNIRAEVLAKLAEKGLAGYDEFTKIVNLYYKEPQTVISELGIKVKA